MIVTGTDKLNAYQIFNIKKNISVANVSRQWELWPSLVFESSRASLGTPHLSTVTTVLGNDSPMVHLFLPDTRK